MLDGLPDRAQPVLDRRVLGLLAGRAEGIADEGRGGLAPAPGQVLDLGQLGILEEDLTAEVDRV